MATVSHSKAPISELILGLTYDSKVLDDVAIHKVINLLTGTYPNVQYLNTIHDEFINEKEGTMVHESNPLHTGALLFRLRTSDFSRLVQIQGNKIYFNWVREDSKDPNGIYPGFENIYTQFIEIVGIIGNALGLDMFKGIKYYELTYHDRIFWEDYVKDLSMIDSIVNISPPTIDDKENINSFMFQNSTIFKETNDMGILSINSSFSPKVSRKVLGIEYSIKGGKGVEHQKWFATSRARQSEMFLKLINDKILKLWE